MINMSPGDFEQIKELIAESEKRSLERDSSTIKVLAEVTITLETFLDKIEKIARSIKS
jgi:hypothetical protein